ncbi:MAG: outer membrane protein assembly factor BamA [Myxococcota bacterium]
MSGDHLHPRPILALLWLLFVATAWSGPAQAASSDATALEGRTLRTIRFEGLRRVEAAAAKLGLTSREGRRLALSNVAEDVQAVYGTGYFNDVQAFAEPAGAGEVDLVFVVKEKPAVRGVVIKDNESIGDDDVEEVVDIRPFTILDEKKVRQNRQKVLDLYREKGFYLADVESELVDVGDNQVDVVLRVIENAKVEVRSIRFVGNRNISSSLLKRSIETREGNLISFLTGAGTYRKDAFEIDLLRLSSQYFDRGYINVRIDTPDVEISPDRKYVYITMRIEEGEQFNVGEVGFSGEMPEDGTDLADLVSTKPGEVFNRSKLGKDLQRLKSRYEDDGYAYANVTPQTQVDASERIIDLIFDVQRGSKVFYERIDIVGNTKTRDKVIRRELRIYEGELTSAWDRERSKARVTALGYFETVEITTKRGSQDDLQIVEVKVQEKATGTFQVGAGFSSAENFIATAQIQQDNFLGNGQSLQLSAQISSLRQLFQFRFTEPYLFDTLVNFSFNAFNTETQFRSFIRSATGGDLTVGYLLTDEIRAFLTYNLEFVRSRGSDGSVSGQPAFFPLNNSGRISSVRLTGTYDSRDNRLFPTRGMFHSLSAEFSETFLGASENRTFQRFRGFARFYQPLPFNGVFKVSLRAGYLNSTATQALSPAEKFIMGGINTLRGYLPFRIGPERRALQNNRGNAGLDPYGSSFTFIEGGNKEFLANVEIEVPIFQQVGIRGVLFLDAGNVFAEEENFFYLGGDVRGSPCRPGELLVFPDGRDAVCPNVTFDYESLPAGLFWSVGFGFRWFSPIGPLRFEWGIPLTRRPDDPAGPLFEFSIGNSF